MQTTKAFFPLKDFACHTASYVATYTAHSYIRVLVSKITDRFTTTLVCS